MKVCTKCGNAKPLGDFYADKCKKDGLQSRCKVCTNEASTKRQADNPEVQRATRAKWRTNNLERAREIGLNWRHENIEKARAQDRRWGVENPEKRRAKISRRRAAQLQRTPPWADHTKIAAVYAEQQRYLELGIEVHVDHIVPLCGKTASGLHTHDNLQLLLATDNCSKSNHLPVDAHAIEPTWKRCNVSVSD